MFKKVIILPAFSFNTAPLFRRVWMSALCDITKGTNTSPRWVTYTCSQVLASLPCLLVHQPSLFAAGYEQRAKYALFLESCGEASFDNTHAAALLTVEHGFNLYMQSHQTHNKESDSPAVT